MTSSGDHSITLNAEAGGDGSRLDRFVSHGAAITRSRAQALITGSFVSVNGVSIIKPSQKVHTGDHVSITMPVTDDEVLLSEDISIEILYDDEHLVVVNKPPGLVVYPAAGHSSGTLMNALKHRFGPLTAIGGPLRPGVVHRLDKDTSGVMVVARTDMAYYSLVEQFKVKSTARTYMALVNGAMEEDSGVIEAPIGRSTSDRKKMSTQARTGKYSRTNWKVLLRFPGATMVEVVLDTGRTHQIRVHFASIGHSVLGDRVYGRKLKKEYKGRHVSFPRQMLHARELGFDHPATGERMTFSTEPPEDFLQVVEELKKF